MKPRPVKEPIVNRNFLITMIYRGIILTIVVLGLFELYDTGGLLASISVPASMVGYVQTYALNPTLSGNGLLVAYNEWKARSITFLVMMFSEMFNAYNCRSEFRSIFKLGLFTNKFMIFAIGSSSLLTIILFIPGSPLLIPFNVIPLTWEWLWLIPDVFNRDWCRRTPKDIFSKTHEDIELDFFIIKANYFLFWFSFQGIGNKDLIFLILNVFIRE